MIGVGVGLGTGSGSGTGVGVTLGDGLGNEVGVGVRVGVCCALQSSGVLELFADEFDRMPRPVRAIRISSSTVKIRFILCLAFVIFCIARVH